MNERIEQLRQEKEAARQKWVSLRQKKAERERRREELEAEARELETEAEARALVPGSGGTATTTRSNERLAEIDSEIREIEEAEEEAHAEYQEAEERLEEALAPAIRSQAEETAQAIRQERQALADLGEAALEIYLERVAPAQTERREAVSELHHLHTLLPGRRRVSHRQKGALNSHLRSLLNDATPEERLGFLVLALLNWSQSPSSPVEGLWKEHGIEPDGLSVLYRTILPEDSIHHLRDGRLPYRSSVQI